jgi:hypothetical protein
MAGGKVFLLALDTGGGTVSPAIAVGTDGVEPPM